jgi:pantoate kinase
MKSGFRSTTPYAASSLVVKELYDYKADPLETVNVVNDSKYAAIANEMDTKMLEFFKSQQTPATTVHLKQEAAQNLQLIQNGQGLLVRNVMAGVKVEIFDATGKLIVVKKSTDGDVRFNSLTPGIYIVRSGDRQMKYIHK